MTADPTRAEEREELARARAILTGAREAYDLVQKTDLPTVHTQADLRAAQGERDDRANEAMLESLAELRPEHIDTILALGYSKRALLAEERGFAQGVAWAAGYICKDAGRPSLAADLLRESGYTTESLRRNGAEEYDLRKLSPLPPAPEPAP